MSRRPPVAVASATPTKININNNIRFSSAGSNDPDGGTLGYSWDFGDGFTGSTAANPSHSYSSHGTYTAELTVTDNEGDTDTASVTVTITAPPTADAGSDKSVEIGMLVNFQGSGDDPDDGAPVTYSWALGPGAYDITGSSTASPSCRYNIPGSRTVWLVVRDDENDTATDTLTVTVANIPPVARATGMGPGEYINLSRDSGQASYTFRDGGSYDPDGGPLTYAWSVTGGVSTPPTTSSSVSVTYNSYGTKEAELTVTDDEKNATDSDTVSVVIKTYPTANAGSDATVEVNTPLRFNGSGNDVDEVR